MRPPTTLGCERAVSTADSDSDSCFCFLSILSFARVITLAFLLLLLSRSKRHERLFAGAANKTARPFDVNHGTAQIKGM